MSKDPYRYYRPEARELIEELGKGVLEIEKNGAAKEQVARLLRLAHTLKGAARVVKHATVADLAHSFEDVLGPHRDAPGPVPAQRATELWQLVDKMSKELAALAAAPAPAGGPTPEAGSASKAAASPWQEATATAPTAAPTEERFETVRVDLGEMDALLAGVSQVAVQVASLRRQTAGLRDVQRLAAVAADLLTPWTRAQRSSVPNPADLGRARAALEELRQVIEGTERGLAAGLDRSDAELQQVRDKATTLRLLPASVVFSTLERAARDVANTVGKTIHFETSGGEHRLDGHVLGPLREALLHAVRNAVDHGIESPAERTAAGKPARGSVKLVAERRGGRIAFVCKDDGRGLDLTAIQRAAVRNGILTAAQAASMDAEATVNLMLKGGLTTAREVTAISGRGIGLDVVRDVAMRLKGTVRVQSQPGQGTSIEIEVPLSLSSLVSIVVEVGGTTACVPLDAVRQSLRLAEGDIAHSAQGGAVLYRGQVIPFLSLGRVLGAADVVEHKFWSALILESRRGWVAIGVDRLVGTAEIVVRPLPPAVGTVPTVAGVTFDAEGDPLLILDPDGLVDAARSGQGMPQTLEAPPRPRILVIDDSLTTRMLEQSILESAGYEVDLAISGEEGMDKARATRYGLFVVDVEMPGMDGFEFVKRTRADTALRETPAILVTSLATPEHKKRGLEAGARAYIVKGEFDQGYFLTTIGGLIG